MTSPTLQRPAPQFIVVPLTGLQICRRLRLDHLRGEEAAEVWKTALQWGKQPPFANPLLPLIRGYIACREPELEEHKSRTDWIACTAQDAAFFRLLEISGSYYIDMVIDTQNGPGRTAYNKIECAVEAGIRFLGRRRHHLGNFYVEDPKQPRGVIGSLVMDFGNTATACIFSQLGSQPLSVTPIAFNNPFDQEQDDPHKRPEQERSILKSNTLVLWVPPSDVSDPWLVLGKMAEELVGNLDPNTTYLSAPKKYVRHWPEHQKAEEPTTIFRGLTGHQPMGMFPKLNFVGFAVQDMLQLVVSSLVNPGFTSAAPILYPQLRQILLTYPLTWRMAERELFVELVRKAAARTLLQEKRIRDEFQVELVCSEPVAVAAYILWQMFFHFLPLGESGINLKKPSLVGSLMGATDGDSKVRLLIIDIGGGSTDIVLIEAGWAVVEEEGELVVDVQFRELDSLRFNRAGDRISHIMATAILEHIKKEYQISESLAFAKMSTKAGFTTNLKRNAVSEIARLVEEAKVQFSRNGKPWSPDPGSERELLRCFEPARAAVPVDNAAEAKCISISLPVLRRWIELDRQSMQTRGEPGFMDIFYQLEQLSANLRAVNRSPHQVVLSGRTTRLPFLKEMMAKHLQLPLHRIRLLSEFLPRNLQGPDAQNMDKLAVVYGAHRFKFGSPVRFHPVPREPIFHRYLGTVNSTALGLRLNRVLVEPSAAQPRDCTIRVLPNSSVLLGHAFSKDGPAEVVADVTNHNNQSVDAEVELKDDYAIALKRSEKNRGVVLTERIPGGTQNIVDNFCDTGEIDCDPEGFLAKIVLSNEEEWRQAMPEPT